MPKKSLIVILGQTASGKSELAVKLAKKFNGEIISADSRQIYKGINIGTGKINKKEMRGIPHHLLDVVLPKQKFTPLDSCKANLTGFTVAQYRKLALAAINKIFKKGKVPILCGGTGFYIQAVIDGIVIPEVKPNWKLRKRLEKKSASELYQILKKLDKNRAKNIDKNNPRRLIRAIEIAKHIGSVPKLEKKTLPYPVLQIGIKVQEKELEKRIIKRVEKMIKMGLKKEAKKFPLLIIGYQEWSSPNPKELIIQHTRQYAKRQMTWFKKDPRISWACPHTKTGFNKIVVLCKKFINKS